MTDLEIRQEFASISERLFSLEKKISNYSDMLHNQSKVENEENRKAIETTQEAVDFLIMNQ